MRPAITIAIILMISACNVFAQDDTTGAADKPSLNEILRPVLRHALLDIDDLRLRDDYLERDSMRLALIDSFMADPFYTEAFTENLYKQLSQDPSLTDIIGYGSNILSPLTAEFSPHRNLIVFFKPHEMTNRGMSIEKAIGAPVPELKKIPEELLPLVEGIVYSIINAESAYLEAFERTSFDSLIYGFTLMLTDDELNENKTVEELDSLGEIGEQWAEALPDLLIRFRPGMLLNGARIMASLTDSTIINEPGKLMEKINPRQPIIIDTKYGRIAFGTRKDDTYRGRFLFILEPGGNDHYELTPAYGFQSLSIIDMAGDDFYSFKNDSLYHFTEKAKDLNRHPPGISGYRFLVDYDGDDIYKGADFSIAAGILGVSILKDYKGNDYYLTDTFGPAAGAMGVGVLMDFEGRDTYDGAMYNEGFGFTGGLGILFDQEGHDYYTSGRKYGDILRYVDHYVTFSQGAAYGLRPYLSGGAGFLLDGGGNDLYVSDIFGQASGYWYSAGVIYDISGNDRYQSFQYAQGAGTHMAVGYLCDKSGDDTYFSKGVSQGCGHDYSHGWLVDYDGCDLYSAYDLSQGAGSANGIGAIIDLAGDDRYYVKSDRNTQGYGNPRRDFGSIGIFYDGAGEDHYEGGPGSDRDIWIYSRWGIGWDVPGPETGKK